MTYVPKSQRGVSTTATPFACSAVGSFLSFCGHEFVLDTVLYGRCSRGDPSAQEQLIVESSKVDAKTKRSFLSTLTVCNSCLSGLWVTHQPHTPLPKSDGGALRPSGNHLSILGSRGAIIIHTQLNKYESLSARFHALFPSISSSRNSTSWTSNLMSLTDLGHPEAN